MLSVGKIVELQPVSRMTEFVLSFSVLMQDQDIAFPTDLRQKDLAVETIKCA